MFGIKTKINDGMLYLLNDMVENQVTNAKKELSELHAEDIERRKFLTAQIEYYERELERFKKDVEKQLHKSSFIRPHQSYLVNPIHIVKVSKTNNYTIILSDKSIIPTSTRKRKEIMQILCCN